MKRTLIVTIETTGKDEYRTLEGAEEDLLDHCNAVGNSYRNCSVNAEGCVNPLSDTLISDFCNKS